MDRRGWGGFTYTKNTLPPQSHITVISNTLPEPPVIWGHWYSEEEILSMKLEPLRRWDPGKLGTTPCFAHALVIQPDSFQEKTSRHVPMNYWKHSELLIYILWFSLGFPYIPRAFSHGFSHSFPWSMGGALLQRAAGWRQLVASGSSGAPAEGLGGHAARVQPEPGGSGGTWHEAGWMGMSWGKILELKGL